MASFPTYEAAQKAVSTLIAADIPARDIAIVGQGLRSIERVTGRLGYAAAARSGAIIATCCTGPLDSAIAFMSATLGVGGALGLPISALVTERSDWHVLFWLGRRLGWSCSPWCCGSSR